MQQPAQRSQLCIILFLSFPRAYTAPGYLCPPQYPAFLSQNSQQFHIDSPETLKQRSESANDKINKTSFDWRGPTSQKGLAFKNTCNGTIWMHIKLSGSGNKVILFFRFNSGPSGVCHCATDTMKVGFKASVSQPRRVGADGSQSEVEPELNEDHYINMLNFSLAYSSGTCRQRPQAVLQMNKQGFTWYE